MENPIKPPTKSWLIFGLLLMVLTLGIVFLFLHPNSNFLDTNLEKDKAPWTAGGPINGAASSNTRALPAQLSPESVSSLQSMTTILSRFAPADIELKALLEELENQEQEPFTVNDKNPYTGEMVIVRTKAPPEGTRYFHAQYFTDESGKQFPQHMSFEFRPHKDAFDKAMQAVQTSFSELGMPTQQNPDFIQWDLNNGYVVWIKRLDVNDISENPFNAYTENDLGSIRIAVELHLEGH